MRDERRARHYISSLKALRTGEGGMAVTETQQGHKKLWTLTGEPVPQDPDDPP